MVELHETNTNELLRRALALFESGDTGSAERICSTALDRDPDNVDGLHLMGMFSLELGRPEASVEWSTRALQAAPRSHFAYNNRAAAYLKLRLPAEALADCGAALALMPGFVDAQHNAAKAFAQLKRFAEASSAYDNILQQRPLLTEALAGRSNARRLSGNVPGAKMDADAALKLQPNNPDALFAVGALLHDDGALEEAAQYYERALAAEPRHTNALTNFMRIRFMQGNHAAILEAADNAIRGGLSPGDLDALRGYILHSKMNLCDWSGLDEAIDRLRQGLLEGRRVDASISFNLLSLIEEPDVLLAGTKLICPLDVSSRPILRPLVCANRPVRIAYVSADFREHPAARLLAELIERHDRTSCTPIGVALLPPSEEPAGRRISAAFDEMIHIDRESDEEIAALMRRHDIDVAVDLMGHTANGRPKIFEARAAPVQVNFLGFPGPSGCAWMDYIIADAITIPPEAESYYTEKVCRLPDSYYPTHAAVSTSEPPTRQACGLPREGLVYACFSNSWKITPRRFELWMELLKATPGSVLWLLTSTKLTEANLLREAKRRGVASNRLVFARRTTNVEHLARQALADIMLDTSPYGGHTTTCDALLMGVPVVTVLGQTFPSRVAASILTACHLQELVTVSPEAYFALALDLARDAARRADLRASIRARCTTAPLFDARRYARHMDLAFRRMTEHAASGRDPATFNVAAIV